MAYNFSLQATTEALARTELYASLMEELISDAISIEMDKLVANGCIFSSLTGIQFSPGEAGRECGALN